MTAQRTGSGRGKGRAPGLPAVALMLLFAALLPIRCAADDASPLTVGTVHLLEVDGAIGPITAEYLVSELDPEGAAASADMLVIRLDTPGGLDASMRRIVRAMLESGVPVVVHVAPDGARAASAGVFMLAAAHVSAMAPASNTGAAHPVDIGGKLDETMAEKVTNDAVAYLKSIADVRGRAGDWCEDMVRRSRSMTAEEALDAGLVDLLAADMDDLLAGIDGRLVTVDGRARILKTGTPRIVLRPMSWHRKLMDTLVDPNIAYIFLMLGVYGLFFELSRPGAVLPGVVGAISLMLAVLAFQQLPVNYVGVILILLGMLMLLLEVKITSYGALSIGGATALFLGSILLIDDTGGVGRISLKLILPLIAATVLGFLLIVGMGLRALGRPVASGIEALVGVPGRVSDLFDDAGDGLVRGHIDIAGELWLFRGREDLAIGDKVIVQDTDGLELIVSGRRDADPGPSANI